MNIIPKASVETITPEKAAQILKEHKNFRKLRQRRVTQYARAMTAGQWRVSEPLMFNCDGSLLNGQHRLQAVILANIPIDFLILRNVEQDVVHTLDTNLPRSGKDVLLASGAIKDYATQRASVVRRLVAGRSDNTSLLPSATEYALLYPILEKAVDFVVDCFPLNRRGANRAAIITVWGRAMLCHPADTDRLRQAAEIYQSLKFSEDDEPLRLLMRYAMGQPRAGGSSLQRRDFNKASRALHAWLNNEKIGTLLEASTDLFPLPPRILSRLKELGFTGKDSDE